MTPRLVAVVNRDGKITAQPAPSTLEDRIRQVHTELWACEPGPGDAERRDDLRAVLFALYRRRALRVVP